ncbi:hypothetical protein [Bdellovibrio bacteriovorus]|nr:hypothetical protein [Bdellovibrio bacteriovorus]
MSSMRWGLYYSSVKAILIVFMAMIVLSPNISSALHRCDSHQQSVSQDVTTLNQHSEESSASHHESHDCACPTHRVDCCHFQAAPSLPKLNLVSIYFELAYSQDLFAPPSSPLLDGPFQPPRA